MSHTRGPWIAQHEDWCGEPSPHRIYIAGNQHEVYDEDDDGERDEGEPSLVATGVCIVEGNATSRETTEANARLIEASPDLLTACQKAMDLIIEIGNPFSGGDQEVVAELRAAITKAKGATPCESSSPPSSSPSRSSVGS